MIIYKGKKYKVVKAAGFRLGIGYLPSYKNNKDISPGQARHLIVWCGPYFVTRTLPAPRGYEPRMPWDDDRLSELIDARRNTTEEIAAAYRAQHRWNRHVNMAQHYGMGQAKVDEMFNKEGRNLWQSESDAVKLREMEDND